MKIVNFTEARKHFAKTLDEVIDDAEETVIHRSGHPAVVLLSYDDWTAMKETMYLLGNPANADFLRRGIAELDAGNGEEHDLLDVQE